MTKEMNIGNLTLNKDHPRICASLTGASLTELENELKVVQQTPPDILEWRFDLYELQDLETLTSTLNFLKNSIGNIPLIFTIRTSREGSASDYSDEAYHALCSAAMDTGLIDAIDLEGTRPEELLKNLVSYARSKQITSIYSYHNFNETPADATLESVSDRAKTLGADLVKLAVMPTVQADVIRFINWSHRLSTEIEMPIITIAMDTIGTITRIACNLTGSVMTFAVLKQASAPGQIPLGDLRKIMALVNTSI